MPTLSILKSSLLSALKNPHDVNNPRLGRRVISFDEALSNLKSAKTRSAPCAAFHRFGRCRKDIPLGGIDLLTNLDQLNMADVQTPIKLMPLMLCSTHWGKTIYNNALFLDWLSMYGSQKDNQHFENIVVDYQSAIAIDDETSSLSIGNTQTSGQSAAGTQSRPVSAPSSPVKEELRRESPRLSPVSPGIRNYTNLNPIETTPHHTDNAVPESSVVMSMESYASIELGAAKLEIIYQDDLKCIAMTSDGWRCQEIIHQDRLLHARRLLNKSVVSDTELDLDLFSFLVLCPGHAGGDLSCIYSGKWSAFAEKRLPKEEAMAKFDAEFWMSVEFFGNEVSDAAISKTIRRSISASHIHPSQNRAGIIESDGNTGINFLPAISKIPFVFRGDTPEYSLPAKEAEPSLAKNATDSKPFENKFLFETDSMKHVDSKIFEFQAPGIPLQFSSKEDPSFDTPTSDNSSSRRPEKAPDFKPEDNAPSTPNAFPDLRMTNNDSKSDVKLGRQVKTVINDRTVLENETRVQDLPPGTSTGGTTRTPSVEEFTLPPSPLRSLNDIHDDMLSMIRIPNWQRGENVYISKSLNGRLIRIGTAKNMQLPKSLAQSRSCSLDALNLVEVDVVKVKNFPVRVLSLVYLELANFKVQTTCQHGADGPEAEEHERWFKVPEQVALQSVRLWSDFVEQAYTSTGNMSEEWAKSYLLIPRPSSHEIWLLRKGLEDVWEGPTEVFLSFYYNIRHDRYETWMRDWKAVFLRHPKITTTEKQPLKVIPVRLPGQTRTVKVAWHKISTNADG